MIRAAIIGYSGSGRSTLATALAGIFLTRPVADLDEAWTRLEGDGPLILDGVPRTVADLERLDARAPAGRGIDRVLYLQASAETRLARIARTIVSGAAPAQARDRLLHPADLAQLRKHLEPSGRLAVIDASRTRSEVLQDALTILGVAV